MRHKMRIHVRPGGTDGQDVVTKAAFAYRTVKTEDKMSSDSFVTV